MNEPDAKIDVSVRLEYIEALRLAAYNSFNDRRSYEWKLSLAIWTAIAVLVAGLVQPGQVAFPFHGIRYGVGATIVGMAIVALHVYFSNCLARANTIDRKKVLNYANQIESALQLPDTDLANEIKNLIVKLPKPFESRWMLWWQWGHISQITMTILLIAVAVAFVWVRTLRWPN